MRIKGNPPQLDPTHSRGVLVWRYHKDGRVTVQKWPRRRPGILPQVTQDQVAVWDMAQEWVKTPLASDYAIALRDTVGTAFYARDILISAMYGNYVSWPGYGWRFRMAQNIQAMLDTISDEVGALLVRTPAGWVGLAPGTAGQVLTMGAAVPDWEDQVAPSGAIGATVEQAVATHQSIANVTDVNVTWDTVVVDDSSFYDAAHPTRLTVPSGGWYVFMGNVRWTSRSSGGQRDCWFRLNGSLTFGPVGVAQTNTLDVAQNFVWVAKLAAGDYVELDVFQATGSALTLNGASMSVAKL